MSVTLFSNETIRDDPKELETYNFTMIVTVFSFISLVLVRSTFYSRQTSTKHLL